jgi:hypothetical protein
VIRLLRLSATYSEKPSRLKPTPVRADHQRRRVGALDEPGANYGHRFDKGRSRLLESEIDSNHRALIHDAPATCDGAVQHMEIR